MSDTPSPPEGGQTRHSRFALAAFVFWLWALLPVAVIAVWLRINPGFFAVPARRDAWMSRGVFGERVWLNRKAVPIPAHHARMAHVTSAVSLAGLAVSLYGLIAGHFTAAALGWAIMMLGKLWFIDRMVWLYEDMRDTNPDYAGWSRPGPA